MRDKSYKPVYVAGATPTARRRKTAQKMINDLVDSGKKKAVYFDGEALTIAKVIGSVRKVLFFPGLIFIYTKQVTEDNVLVIGGWSGSSLRAAKRLDFNDLEEADLVSSIGYSWFLRGKSQITMRKSYPDSNPPVGNYPIKAVGGITVGPEEGYVIEQSEGGSEIFGNYLTYHRGAETDYVYTTNGMTTVGDGHDPTIWYKDRVSGVWHPFIALTYPTPSGFALFPVWNRDDRIVFTKDEVFYLAASNGIPNDYWEIYKIDTKEPPSSVPVISFGTDAFGGDYFHQFTGLTVNYVDDWMGFVLSEYDDNNGDPSDYEVFLKVDGSFMFEFKPGDYLGYEGRTEDYRTRVTYSWIVSVGIFGFIVQNTQAQPDKSLHLPDGLFLIDATAEEPKITLVHQAAEGLSLGHLVINEKNPNEILIGESTRTDFEVEEHRMYHVKMKAGKMKVVTEEAYFQTGPSSFTYGALSGTTFVR